MSQLGELFRQRRTSLGISLGDLQDRTKIRDKYLAAIEEGNFDVIPGEVYLRGFIRAIARELDIDQQEAMEAYYQDIGQGKPEKTQSVEASTSPSVDGSAPVLDGRSQVTETRQQLEATSLSQRRRSRGTKKSLRPLWILVVIVAAVVAIAYWYHSQQQPLVPDESHIELPLDPPEEQIPEPEEPKVKVVRQNPGEANPIYLVDPGPLQVVLSVKNGKCWLGGKVDSQSRQVTLDSSNSQANSLELEAKQAIKLRIGNPAALHLTINGEDLGIIGGNNPCNLTIEVKPAP